MLDPKSYRDAIRPSATAKSRAKQLRRNMSPAEVRVWAVLKGNQLGGLKFRNQAPLGEYIADFYCPVARLVVEIDGHTHATDRARDARRNQWMESCGIEVLRITPRQLALEFEAVCGTISTRAFARIKLLDEFKVSER